MQRLHTEDRSMLAGNYCNTQQSTLKFNTNTLKFKIILLGKLALGVPVQRVLNDIRETVVGTDFKRIHLLEKT